MTKEQAYYLIALSIQTLFKDHKATKKEVKSETKRFIEDSLCDIKGERKT